MGLDTDEFEPDAAGEHPILARLGRDVTLSQGARQGAAWIAPARMAAQAGQFLATLITSRILLPSQFGEVAIVLAISSFAFLFTDLGLGAAIVHAKRVTHELLSTAFWLALGSGVALTVIVSAAAYPVSRIYDQPDLFPLMVLASLNFTLSCGTVHVALLERTFNFRQVAIVEVSASLVGSFAVPIAALAGLGTPSLVLGPLITSTLITAGLFATVRWFPDRRPTRAALDQLWRFSRGLVGFNALNYWSRNLDTVLLGGTVSTTSLGQYSRAYNLTLIPVQQMTFVLSRVLYPALARMQDEPQRMGNAWIRAVSAASALALAGTVTLAATAPSLVVALFGRNWEATAPVLELLAIATVPQIIGSSVGMIYRAAGATGTMLKMGILSTVLTAVAIVGGLPWGTEGVAVALIIRFWFGLPITMWPVSRIVQLPLRRVMSPAVAMLAPGAAMAAGELAVRFLAGDSLRPLEELILQLIAGLVLYVAVMHRTKPDLTRALLSRAKTAARAAHRRVKPA